jgi:hypothetical protein
MPLMLVLGCSSGREVSSLTVVLDTNQPRAEREVIAIPVDPASLRLPTAAVTSSSRARTDSLSRLASLSDSVQLADERFQAMRDSLNVESRSMERLDRHTAEYASRYDIFRRRTTQAESIRVARDRARQRLAPLAARISASGGMSAEEESTLRSSIDALSVQGRRAVSVKSQRDTVRLALGDGTWWIGVGANGHLPRLWTRVVTPTSSALVIAQ